MKKESWLVLFTIVTTITVSSIFFLFIRKLVELVDWYYVIKMIWYWLFFVQNFWWNLVWVIFTYIVIIIIILKIALLDIIEAG